MSKTITVEVTQEDIDKARNVPTLDMSSPKSIVNYTTWRCPLELALDRAIPGSEYRIGSENVYDEDFISYYPLSLKAQTFVDIFDDEKRTMQAKPGKFRITLP